MCYTKGVLWQKGFGMKINELPFYDRSDNPTGCCPRFNPEGWDNQQVHLNDKLFARAETKSIMHIPVNMGTVFSKAQDALEKAGTLDSEEYIVLSRELSSWKAEHLFLTEKDVEGLEMVRLSGDFVTKVFEGPFKDAEKWHEAMLEAAKRTGRSASRVYFFYTTCPKCAKTYGKNFVVGFAELKAEAA